MSFRFSSALTGAAAALLTLSLAAVAFGNEPDAPTHASAETPEPTEFVSEHQGSFNGRRLRYRARAGETYIQNTQGEPTAAIFSFDYIALDAGDDRPVTFIWNGGPGSASVWLHMGTFGPKRVVVPSDAQHAGAPPFPVVDSVETILDSSDLVFVDPVGTGFSRALGEHESKEFWGLNEDAESMAAFIRSWLTEHGRWNSPRFLLGESFGTTRAAAVANLLENKYRVSLNGIVFISQALDYAGSTPYIDDNLISHITYLPTMAATAYYHGRVDAQGASLEDWVQTAREFATDELLPALFKGNRLDDVSRARVRDELVRLTGLSPEYVERANLRVDGKSFARELLRDEGKALGHNDARYIGNPVNDLTQRTDFDAASNAISGAFKAGLMSYMRDELGIDWERLYLSPADPELGKQWNWNPEGRDKNGEPHWVNTAHDLVAAMEANPGLKVLVASGYYDLVTPFFDAEYTLNRYGITPERILYRYYGGGHMMYVNEDARISLLQDVRDFMNSQSR